MKTLEEVINRQDYVKLSSELNERVQELAHKVVSKMTELDVKELPEFDIDVRTVTCNSGYSERYLFDEDGRSLETKCMFYYGGDFNCKITPASSKSKLQFLNSCRDIFNELDSIETSKCDDIKKALSDNEYL